MLASTSAAQPCPGAGHPAFHYRGAELYCEAVAVAELAERHGTPLYVYSTAAVQDRCRAVRLAFGATAHVCYAMKANSNLSLLRLIAAEGCGFDLVSGGELQRLQAAGLSATDAVFAGVGKQAWEIEQAVAAGILLFNVESPHELDLLAAAGAAAGTAVPVALRLNPDVEAGTHAYISTGQKQNKFGVDFATAATLVEAVARNRHLRLVGYHVHLGSQLRSIEPYLRAFGRVAEFLDGAAVRRDGVRCYDLGGGFGLGYGQGEPLDPAALAAALLPLLQARGLRPVVEPGRFLVGDAGALVTTVLGEKGRAEHRFLLVDAAMNDLLRPALYQAEHPIVPVRAVEGAPPVTVDVVGPVCETGDFLARSRQLPAAATGDRLAVLGAGAYGASMASNYNSRRQPAEVLVDGASSRLIRRRQAFASLWADEVDL